MTSVGEKGISLSGGQRQRVSIARLLYADRPINILDDAFSALDASTASLVFSRALLSHRQNTTRILVTHSLHLLPKVDWVVVMNEGVVIEEGTFAELTNSGAAFSRFLEEFGLGMNNSVDDIVKNQQVDTAKSDEKKVDKVGSNVVGGMQAEERHVGTVGAKGMLVSFPTTDLLTFPLVYWQFVQTVPVALFIPIFTVAAILFQGGSVMNPYWLVFWQEK
jgi:ABC-type multidrug transport system ATPase subunit